MSRPTMEGLTYFSLDTRLDDEFELIEGKFGLIGFAVVIKLFQKIYSHSYFIDWTERELLMFKNRINVDINLINEVINECLKWGLLSQELYDQYGILTSRGIQKRYVEGTQRRKEVSYIREYLLIELKPQSYPERVNVNIYSINDNINPKKDDINPQSKVKESKVIDHVVDDQNKTPLSPQTEVEKQNAAVVSAWKENFKIDITKNELDKLVDWRDNDGFPNEAIVFAIEKAASAGKRFYSYIDGIFRKWLANNQKTMEAIHAAEEEWQAGHSRDAPTTRSGTGNTSKVVKLNGGTHGNRRSPAIDQDPIPIGKLIIRAE